MMYDRTGTALRVTVLRSPDWRTLLLHFFKQLSIISGSIFNLESQLARDARDGCRHGIFPREVLLIRLSKIRDDPLQVCLHPIELTSIFRTFGRFPDTSSCRNGASSL